MRLPRLDLVGASLFVLVVAACGSKSPGGADANPLAIDSAPGTIDAAPGVDAPPSPDLSQHYEPWKVGSVWVYKDTDPVTNATAVKPTTVEAYEDVGGAHAGTFAFRVRGEKLWGPTVSWENYEGNLGVRYEQIDYDPTGAQLDQQVQNPHRLKIDETPAHLVANASYTENFNETTTDVTGTMTNAKSENWLVVSTSESVTVPAGTYNALHLRRTNPSSNKVKDFWFVKGIGKVKETGGGQIQELMSFTP